MIFRGTPKAVKVVQMPSHNRLQAKNKNKPYTEHLIHTVGPGKIRQGNKVALFKKVCSATLLLLADFFVFTVWIKCSALGLFFFFAWSLLTAIIGKKKAAQTGSISGNRHSRRGKSPLNLLSRQGPQWAPGRKCHLTLTSRSTVQCPF